MTPPDIFLSYNRDDGVVARVYAEALTRAGLNVWWDVTLRSGDAYDEVTEAALRGAKAVIVLWSPRSVTSRWVRSEATIAHRNKTLLPVTIEPCERPVMFELTQTAELSHWHGEQDDKIWQAFLDDVQRMVGKSLPARLDTAVSPTKTTGQAFIALLPISHRSGETAIEILAEELTEEITRELAQNCFFKVISAGTMAAWRGRTSDSKVVGKELSARYLIESKLQCTDEEVRLTVQLIDSATGSMLWSSRFVRKLAEPMLIPDDFPFAVAFTLGEQIEQLETNRAMLSPRPYSAWDHLLRGMGYFLRSSSDNTICAIEETRLAIAAEPDLGLAHALLANGLTIQVLALGESLDAHRSREIQEHFRRAIQLDGDNPIVLLWLAGSDFVIGNDETYLRLARRLVEIHPYSPYSYFALGAACFKLGRTMEAIAAFNRQDSCGPSDKARQHGLTCLGMANWYEGKPIEAEAALDRALTLRPDLMLALKWKAIVASYRQEEDAALAALQRLRETEPTITLEQHVRQIEEHPGLGARSAEAVAILRRLWDASGGGS